MLKQYAQTKTNIILLDIICFEYILLEFKYLLNWIYAPDDEFLQKRATAIIARTKLIELLHAHNTDYKALRELVNYDSHLDENTEQLAASVADAAGVRKEWLLCEDDFRTEAESDLVFLFLLSIIKNQFVTILLTEC